MQLWKKILQYNVAGSPSILTIFLLEKLHSKHGQNIELVLLSQETAMKLSFSIILWRSSEASALRPPDVTRKSEPTSFYTSPNLTFDSLCITWALCPKVVCDSRTKILIGYSYNVNIYKNLISILFRLKFLYSVHKTSISLP